MYPPEIITQIQTKTEEAAQVFDFECFTSQSITESMLVEFLHEIMKQHTSLSVIDLRSLQSTMPI